MHAGTSAPICFTMESFLFRTQFFKSMEGFHWVITVAMRVPAFEEPPPKPLCRGMFLCRLILREGTCGRCCLRNERVLNRILPEPRSAGSFVLVTSIESIDASFMVIWSPNSGKETTESKW